MRSKDRKVCENIIEVFRDKGNDKDIPVNTDSSDSESLPNEKPERKNGVIDELNFVNEDKQEEEEVAAPAAPAAPAVPAVPAPTGENNSDVEKPAEEEDAVDEHLPEEREETGARPSLVDSEEDAVDEHVEPAAPEVPAVPEVPAAPEVPAVPEPAEEEEDAVDEHLPAEPPAPAEEEEDAVDEHTPEEPAVAPIALPEEPAEEEGARPSEVQDDLQSPRELFPDEPEIITHSNLPPGWDIDPRSAPAPVPKPREHSHRHSKPTQPAQPAQPTQPTQPAETEQQAQSAEHKTELRSLDSIKKNVQVPSRCVWVW